MQNTKIVKTGIESRMNSSKIENKIIIAHVSYFEISLYKGISKFRKMKLILEFVWHIYIYVSFENMHTCERAP